MKSLLTRGLLAKVAATIRTRPPAPPRHKRSLPARLRLEAIEDRCVPATFTVLNNSDSGAGSLRQAIIDANGNAGGDIIQFDSGVTGTITLTSGELGITDPVDLQGPGAGVVTVSGNNASRVFHVTSNATISGLTIANGKADLGGGIRNDGTLTVSDTTLAGNAASIQGGGIYNNGTLSVQNTTLGSNSATISGGGGIANFGSALTVDNCTFSTNSSYEGGGIANYSTATVDRSTFSGNTGSQTGGGIISRGTLTVDRSTFTGNTASGGGGLNHGGGVATVRRSTFSGSSSGGGLNNGDGGTMTVEGCTLIGNKRGIFNSGTMTVLNSTISGNNIDQGGGILNWSGGILTVFNSTVTGNSAYNGGGGIYNPAGTVTLHNTIVAANSYGDIKGAVAVGSSHNLIGVDTDLTGIAHGTNGNQIGTVATSINPMLGALQANGGPTATRALLPGSPAIDAGNNSLIPAGVTTDQRGAGFARIDSGTVDIGAYELVADNDPFTFVVNTLADTVDADPLVTSLREAVMTANANPGSDIVQFAPGLAGTITLTGGELAITTDALDVQGPGAGVITVSGNHASRVFNVTANAIISGLTIADGSATLGGGISNAYGTLTVRNATFSGNSALSGAGISNTYGALTVDGCTFTGNTATASGYQSGGGLYNSNYGTQSVVRNSIFTGNSAANGGGIHNQGTLTVDNSTLSTNSAPVGGGIANGGTLTVSGTAFSGNSAGQGGGIFNAHLATVSDSTFSGNTAPNGGSGAGIFNDDRLIVDHCTFTNNSAGLYGGGIFSPGTSSSISVDTCLFTGNSAGASGGGINNDGTAIVRNSTLSANPGGGGGGGIYTRGTMTVDGCALLGNSAGGGGGLNIGGGALTLRNSTLSGNFAGVGGGIDNYAGTLVVQNCTLSGNTSDYHSISDNGGGGIRTLGTTTLTNTIVAANISGDIAGALSGSSSHNLIGVDRKLTGIAHGTNGNQIGTVATPINPMLGALQANGGPTQTLALLPGSPAIDAGNNSLIPDGVTTDQRGTGYARIDSGTVDIGAYELVQNRPPVADPGGPYAIPEGGSLSLNGSGSSDPDPLDTLTYSWDVNGDGVFGDATGVSPTLTWAQLVALGINDGPHSNDVKVRVDDSHSHVVDSLAATLTLTNAPPTVGVSGPMSGVRGQSLNYTLTSTDPSPDDQTAGFTFRIDWDGDGTVDQLVSGGSGMLVGHTFTTTGPYTILVTAEDKDHGISNPAPLGVSIETAQIQPDPYHPGGTALVVGGTTEDDTIVVHATPSSLTVAINGVVIGPFPNPGGVVVYAQAGNDDVRVTGSALSAFLFGEDDNDRLTGGNGGNMLDGGNGNDTLNAGGGHDSLDGGEGNDSLVGSNGGDTLLGGAGNDTLKAGSGSDYLDGGSDDDSVVGGNGDDTLLGGTGNDTMDGGSGHDYLDAGNGNNRLEGGNGDDNLLAGEGKDTLDGGSGRDHLDAGEGNDILVGGNGDDTLLAGGGNDDLDGGSGDDTLDGGAGYGDTLTGGNGDDALTDADGVARADGGSGDDYILLQFDAGWNLNDSVSLLGSAVSGGNGDDVFELTANSSDFEIDLNGNNGNDQFILHGVWSKIRVFGGTGTDSVLSDGIGAIELDNVEVGP